MSTTPALRQNPGTFLRNSKNAVHGAATRVGHALSNRLPRRHNIDSYRPNSQRERDQDRYDIQQYDNHKFSFEFSGLRSSPEPIRSGQSSRDSESHRLIQNDSNHQIFSPQSVPQYIGQPPRASDTVAYLTFMSNFQPGNIVSGYHYEEAFSNADPGASDSYFYSPKRNLICAKYRKFVIISTHARHYTCLALYTYNGNGTKYKPDPDEYVSIQDHRAKDLMEPQSSHKPLETDEMTGSYIRPQSVVHLSYPISRAFNIQTCLVGRLRPESTERLIRLHRGEPIEHESPVVSSKQSAKSTMSRPSTAEKLKRISASANIAVPAFGQIADLAMRCKLQRRPSDDSALKRNVKQKTDSILTVHSGMAINEALESVRYSGFQDIFRDMSWEDAAKLDATALRKQGVWKGPQRENLANLFANMAKASSAGGEWEVRFDQTL